MTVHFFFVECKVSLSQRTRLKKFINAIFKKEGYRLISLNYIFCSDNYLLDINRKYLKHNYYTDIITFGISQTGKGIEGEVYISVDRVRDNANQMNQSLKKELHRVIFHGALHLCGYKDKLETEMTQMRLKEEEYLTLYLRFPRGTFNN